MAIYIVCIDSDILNAEDIDVNEVNEIALKRMTPVASGATYQDALENLITAINADEVNTETGFLRMYEE